MQARQKGHGVENLGGVEEMKTREALGARNQEGKTKKQNDAEGFRGLEGYIVFL